MSSEKKIREINNSFSSTLDRDEPFNYSYMNTSSGKIDLIKNRYYEEFKQFKSENKVKL